MTIRGFSKVIISCIFLAACSSSNSIAPSSVPSQSKNAEGQKDFNFQNQDPRTLVRLAKGFEQSGDLVNALKFYGQASIANPKLLEPWIGIIELLRGFDNPVGARRALKDAGIYHPADPDLALLAAEIEIADDKATDAITILAPYMNRKDYRFANLLGVASEMMGSPNLARKYYSDALAYNPSISGITNNLALSYSFYDDNKTAISILQKNLNDPTSRTLSYETLAIIYAMDNQIDAALSIARSTLSDKEVNDNFLFYQALAKLPPKLRARSVFTRSIPVDALPYLNENVQLKSEPKPENKLEVTKAERARQLVTQRFKDNSGEAPQTNIPPKIITINRSEHNASDDQRPEMITPDDELAVSSATIVPNIVSETHLTEEDESLSVKMPVTSPYEGNTSDDETKPENTIDSLAEMTIAKDKQEPLIEKIIPEEKTEPIPEATVVDSMLSEYMAKPLPETVVPEEKTEPVLEAKLPEEKSESIAEDAIPTDYAIEPKTKEPETEVSENMAEDMAVLEARNAYRVQIAAFSNIVDAQKEWCRIAKRVSAAGVDDQPNVRIFGEGAETKYRLLLGEYDESADANATCEALKSQKMGCYVVKGAGQLRPLDGECKR